MPPLLDGLRKLLTSTIRDARRVAEPGARRALEALAVHRPRFHDSMSSEEQALRNRLRAHGRQLGDVRDRTGAQEMGRLAHEVAYEHWHRMLFARFLAENHLLIEPDSGVAISMAECEELARDQGVDPWALAARFAQRMLPRIFRPNDPALAVTLAPETRHALERLVASLPAGVFTADDALGWTYQFWQAEKKDAVNASGVKIGADELPAVTQLFTEHYMVLFLFHNTIGAWRAGKVLADRPDLAESAGSEAELREAVRLDALGGYDFSYLRFVRELREGDEEGKPSGPWRPAAGTFPGWPKRAAELRVLDPCCGSGHFLVEGLELLVRLRMEEEGLGLEPALRAVLAENLFGLEIDPRCAQIAAFNLALAAWRLVGRPIDLPPLHIACSGLAVASPKSEWLALSGDDQRLRGGMERLYALFEKAPELGSLIDPRTLTRDASTYDLFLSDFADLQPLLERALQREHATEDEAERVVAAQGMACAAELLAGQYTLVGTNVPFVGRGEQSDGLKAFADHYFREARSNLATTFVLRILGWLGRDGTMAVVTPQNWLFLTSYRKLRENLLATSTWTFVVHLGPAAFRDMNWWAAKTSLVMLSVGVPAEGHKLAGLDLGGHRDTAEKSVLLRAETILLVPQADQLGSPDAMLSLRFAPRFKLLSDVALAYQGTSTGDNPAAVLMFWELPVASEAWTWLQASAQRQSAFSGRERVLRRATLDRHHLATVRGREAWGRDGVAVSRTGRLVPTRYTGEHFSNIIPVIVPRRPQDLLPVWCFSESGELEKALRAINPALSVDNGYFGKIEFDLSRWQQVAADKYPSGLPQPQSDDPTQWLFHGHPANAEPRAILQVAVGRLLGYRWPPEHDTEMRLATDARGRVERCRELDSLAERDGIVCLTALRGEAPAADRLRGLLAVALGDEWSNAKERELLAAAAEGKPAISLEEWLHDRFFEEHCRLFHQWPFVWHVWDGRRDGFNALVNYHRLAGPDREGRRTLEALTYSYLGDWIERQKAEQREGREGADGRLAAALDLQDQLERILAGAPPCDIFVRWKPLHQQPIGWEPDINDGVRLNIRPFLSVALRAGGRKGAGILRWKPPAIHWRKDRGKEPQSLRPKADFPWFWGYPSEGPLDQRKDFLGGRAFDGNRWNDLHYTSAAKRAARERAQGTGNG